MATRKSQTTAKKQQSKLDLIEVTNGKQTLKVQKQAIPFGFAPKNDTQK
jgi:hypothetical protein